MSRRRGEFEHRTSIFEGAFRAWSHLGGLEPSDLETKQASEFDPFNHPLENDPRVAAQKAKKSRPEDEPPAPAAGTPEAAAAAAKKDRREFPYEPLPRSGLAHPFVQAILSPWLGPDADQDAIQLGLTTLRTWWQHRRKGESGSAVVALGTEKMRGVVEGYTRHFFNLAHCLVVNDKEQPPRTLHGKMRDLEKTRNKNSKGKKRARDENDPIKAAAMAFNSGFGPGSMGRGPGARPNPAMGMGGGNMDPMMAQQLAQMGGGQGGGMPPLPGAGGPGGLNNLQSLVAAQQRQLAESGGVHTSMGPGGLGGIPGGGMPGGMNQNALGGGGGPVKAELPNLVKSVSSAATRLGISPAYGNIAKMHAAADPSKYGDPSITPVAVVSPNQSNGQKDIQFCMTVEGITCNHCIKIIETVLKGCHGSRSPVEGLLDAAADMELGVVIIKVGDVAECRRIAHEAARNLSMVGYTAKAKSASVPPDMTLGDVYGIVEGTIPRLSPMMGFNWSIDCGCPDNNVLRQDCPRHSQMGPGVIEVFDKTKQLLTGFVNGCSKKTGMPCTAGVLCHCRNNGNGSDMAAAAAAATSADQQQQQQQQQQGQQMGQQNQPQGNGQGMYQENDTQAFASYQQPIQDGEGGGGGDDANSGLGNGGMPMRGGRNRSSMRMSLGRMSIGGLGGLGRHLSLTSETTFGRAMSGLSALSIDWENMEDFDINVDHSAGINNDIINGQQQAAAGGGQGQQQANGGKGGDVNPAEQQQGQDNGQYGQQMQPRMARRSSLRRNIQPGAGANAFNVSFNM